MALYKHHIDTLDESFMITVDERNIYGSDRLGIYAYPDTVYPVPGVSQSAVQMVPLGYRRYELINHLGNVTTVVTRHQIPVDANSDGSIDGNQTQIVSAYDNSPLGVTSLSFENELVSGDKGYRYGFNEKKMKVSGNLSRSFFVCVLMSFFSSCLAQTHQNESKLILELNVISEHQYSSGDTTKIPGVVLLYANGFLVERTSVLMGAPATQRIVYLENGNISKRIFLKDNRIQRENIFKYFGNSVQIYECLSGDTILIEKRLFKDARLSKVFDYSFNYEKNYKYESDLLIEIESVNRIRNSRSVQKFMYYENGNLRSDIIQDTNGNYLIERNFLYCYKNRLCIEQMIYRTEIGEVSSHYIYEYYSNGLLRRIYLLEPPTTLYLQTYFTYGFSD
jgi:antitoxin component YwqK of YwqJK toxin-antitoxin module